MLSIWSEETIISSRDKLNKDQSVEIAVIGGGISGILIAYELKQRGHEVIILEANRIAGGVTKNTTAKITSQHRLIYHKLLTNLGRELASQYAIANEKAILEYEQIIKKENIDCHFRKTSAYVYSLTDARIIEKEVDASIKVGIKASFEKEGELPFETMGMVRFEGQAEFQPLDFIKEVSKNIEIYEHTKVLSVDGKKVITEHGIVTANHIVLATHYPFINVPGYYFMRMYQQKSYVLAVENEKILQGMYIDEDEKGYSFRSYKNLILIGGANHRTGKNKCGGQYEELKNKTKEYYPKSIYKDQWSTEDCMTLDGIPYIGHFSTKTPHLYVATGYNKWGMTSAMVASKIIADDIEEKENEYREVFKPHRFHSKMSLKSLVIDSSYSVLGLTTQKVYFPKADFLNIPVGHGGIVDYEGKKVGIYKHPKGKTYMVQVKCPHLGCQLEWDPEDLTWDCPCHGSRFDYKGNLINNPAMKGISIYKKQGELTK